MTAEKFVPSPFQPGERLYATGDLGRWRDDGRIEFLGRLDDQVKVRGFRIELGEIEVTLGRHPSVRDAVVLARTDATGESHLVAYVVHESDSSCESAELRAHLKQYLPEYMVPAAFMTMESFPLTANGKVDRRALPAPEKVRPEVETAYAAPEADIERAIAGIWQEVLNLERVGVHDNFFDLGGHSLHLIRVHGELKSGLGKDIPMVEMFPCPPGRALARHLGGESESPSPEPAGAAGKMRAGKARLQKLRERREKTDP
jgi:acyl carrier protein